MSLMDALVYPLRSNNIRKFLALNLVYFIAAIVINSQPDKIMGFVLIPLSFLITAYYYITLRNLARGNYQLPGLLEAFEYYHYGLVIGIMQLILFTIAAIITVLSYINNPGIGVLIGLVLGLIFYFITAIGILRYLVEGEWLVLYEIPENLTLLLSHFRASVSLFVTALGLLIFITGLFLTTGLGFTAIFYDVYNPSITLLGLLSLAFIFNLISFYAILVNTYLWYGYGQALGLLPSSRRKEKPVPEKYSFEKKASAEL